MKRLVAIAILLFVGCTSETTDEVQLARQQSAVERTAECTESGLSPEACAPLLVPCEDPPPDDPRGDDRVPGDVPSPEGERSDVPVPPPDDVPPCMIELVNCLANRGPEECEEARKAAAANCEIPDPPAPPPPCDAEGRTPNPEERDTCVPPPPDVPVGGACRSEFEACASRGGAPEECVRFLEPCLPPPDGSLGTADECIRFDQECRSGERQGTVDCDRLLEACLRAHMGQPPMCASETTPPDDRDPSGGGEPDPNGEGRENPPSDDDARI